MKRHPFVKARRPVPSGRAAYSARVLPVRACFAHRGAPIRLAVRGSALPGCFARHCSPPTAFTQRIRDMVQYCIVAEATGRPPISQRQALLLSQLTISCPRKVCAKLARNSRNGHKLAGPDPDTSASAFIPRTGRVRVLSIVFPQPHTFPVRVQSVTVVRPQSVRSVSGACPRSVRWLACPSREWCIVSLANRPFSKPVSTAIRGRADCPLDTYSSPAAFLPLLVRRAFLLAFRVAFLASSRVRPNLSGCVSRSGVVVLPLGALAAAPGCIQMLRIFCPPRVRLALAGGPSRNRAVLSAKTVPKSKWSDYGCRSQN
jgi:hypothetical protein